MHLLGMIFPFSLFVFCVVFLDIVVVIKRIKSLKNATYGAKESIPKSPLHPLRKLAKKKKEQHPPIAHWPHHFNPELSHLLNLTKADK